MSNICYFLPMSRLIAFVIYPGFELLDVSGPSSVFAEANSLSVASGQGSTYAVEVLSPRGGLVLSGSGLALQTRALRQRSRGAIDTLIVAGANEQSLIAAMGDPTIRRWLPRLSVSAARFGSVCSGAFVLASLGLLDGRRVATHWDGAALLAEMYPKVTVDPDTLYVNDGNVWTSAGVTTGIDMALAMVGRDAGSQIAGHVARRLVVYARRPGYQSQFSPLLRAQVKADNPFAELLEWLPANLDRTLDVPSLAARTGLSERSFYRKFIAVMEMPPARFVESIRLDEARILLAQGLSLKAIAAKVGLSPTRRLTVVFERRFGVPPALFREIHAGP